MSTVNTIIDSATPSNPIFVTVVELPSNPIAVTVAAVANVFMSETISAVANVFISATTSAVPKVFKSETKLLRLSNQKSKKYLNWRPKWKLNKSIDKIIERNKQGQN